ncbi:helix-turn-helix domain-containing protein [Elongatibacter sediminis]|uniref:Helix-turn-helix domain-containing protein n=1 Tax=Elongatibacter sediminis TaxID=3119006 RepID=A0AAW9RDS6_9GAMM
MTLKTYSVQQAAKVCRCHPGSIYDAIRSGKLRARKVGRAWVILERNLTAFLDAPDPSISPAPDRHPRISSLKSADLIDPRELLEEIKRERRSKSR